MKKELLIASALVGTVGLAGVAEAASASYSGHVRNGFTNTDTDAAADAVVAASQQGSLSFSVSETTDSGIKISTGFGVADEGAADGADASGITLTFTDGSKLDLIEAGNAYATHLASVPGATGEQSIGGTTSNTAPTGLTWGNKSTNIGFEYHSAADAMGVEGMKFGISASYGDDGDTASTSTVETAYSVGVSYVTTSGDTTITVGGGFVNADDSNGSTSNSAAESWAVAGTAATGNLTVGMGLSGGDGIAQYSTNTAVAELDGAEVMTAGAKYVSGDITFAVGYADGEVKDAIDIGTNGTTTDSYNSTSASVSYVITSGVSGIIGFTDTEREQEGNTQMTDHSGNAWYIGALVSF